MKSPVQLSFVACILFAAAFTLCAQEPVAKKSTSAADAQRVFTGLLAEYRAGESGGAAHLELLYTWSARILQTRMMDAAEVSRADVTAKQLALHEDRLRQVKAIAEARAKAGESSATELAAARFLVQSADRIPEFLVGQREEPELDAILPADNEGRPLTEASKEMIVNVDHKGEINIAGKKFTLDELQIALDAAAKHSLAKPLVMIRADRRTQLENVIRVISVCNRAGVSHSLSAK